MHVLNLGILAHVDAGKTSLTERLLHTAGVIDTLGSVDDGSTQTDTLALERARGITIRSAVASFAIGDDVTVNLIDTPGHPDFIAEVERALGVLDGAVLVVSAVEGVQAQTRVLMRTLRRLRIPTLLFVNKTDRSGARDAEVLRALAERLSPACVAMGRVEGLGTRDARSTPYGPDDTGFTTRLLDVLSVRDEELLAAYVADGTAPSYPRLRAALAAQTRGALVHPVYFGSAVTGAGVDALVRGIAELLPVAAGSADGPVSGTVFKIERGPSGEKIAQVRMFSGTVRVRDRLPHGAGKEGKVTAVSVFERGVDTPGDAVCAGQIGRLWGLDGIRVGDAIGEPHRTAPAADRHFAPPTLETVVVPRRPADAGALHVALTRLAEQDPLIDLRMDDVRQEIAVSLYGEVQKEVVQATLADDFGVEVTFEETTTIHIERPVGTGAAAEVIHTGSNPFLATVGLRVDPAPRGSGVAFGLEVELGSMPYAFIRAVEETVTETLRHGLYGWRVVDCKVTMTHSGYAPRQSHAHAVFDKSMSSTAGDFRGLTPVVLMRALEQAGTVVCEPVHRFTLDLPEQAYARVLPVLARLGAVPRTSAPQGASYVVEGDVPAAQVPALERRLPALTSGEGVLEYVFDHWREVRGEPPALPGHRRD
ncbi:TetM/TetW/TetO/TetS family tetracycline resistance ribosomal protection protein [Streptomyces sp. PA03-1a]|nr:TetM/TetW/TetO/TetS family tetracycline resistance ribosomal protection protein [Streptomyces sp. PA03-1a]MDX2811338.1 TetM/TetW/TetO/TetS family tetracycline resistance ribosomal protection protein [Streptomyces sp. PA03-5A]